MTPEPPSAELCERASGICRRLEAFYGRPEWKPRAEPLDELVLTVLSQHTNDRNSFAAFELLRGRFPTWDEAAQAPADLVADTIRSCGLANQKAPRIQAILQEVLRRESAYSLDRLATLPTEEARAYLQTFKGVGPKTAACVLMFALGRPWMPVDTHVHRVAKRLALIGPRVSADAAHDVLNALVPPEDLYAFHVNLISHGRRLCHARRPECARCPLIEACPAGQEGVTSQTG